VNSSAGTLTDGSNCTLRGAVGSINSGSNQNGCIAVVSPEAYGINDTITFNAAVFTTATTINVTNGGEIAITESLTIEGLLDGGGAPLITLDGNNANRILNITGAVLAVSRLAFKRGSSGSGYGGAIYAPATTVIVRNSAFENNQANDGGGHYSCGGAIHADTVNVSNSTFKNNQSYDGGAILADTVNVSDSTFEDNQAGGTYGDGGAILAITTNISNSTFEGNQANNGDGGAIYAQTTLEASHLTLLDNSAGQNGAAIFMDDDSSGSIHNSLILSSVALVGATTLCSGNGTFTGSYNIEWVDGTDTTSCSNTNNVSGGSGAIGAIVETTLADNGGPTPTLALPTGSPAIGAVDPGGTTSRMLVIDFSSTPVTATWEDATLDQRGVTRAATAADRSIGAFEYKAPPALPAPIPVLPMPLALLLALGLAGVGVGFRKRKMTKTGIF
jgi:predicted outer membrane repeat protein